VVFDILANRRLDVKSTTKFVYNKIAFFGPIARKSRLLTPMTHPDRIELALITSITENYGRILYTKSLLDA
jgi:hypothetical protein